MKQAAREKQVELLTALGRVVTQDGITPELAAEITANLIRECKEFQSSKPVPQVAAMFGDLLVSLLFLLASPTGFEPRVYTMSVVSSWATRRRGPCLGCCEWALKPLLIITG
jgi:hypothetical protein